MLYPLLTQPTACHIGRDLIDDRLLVDIMCQFYVESIYYCNLTSNFHIHILLLTQSLQIILCADGAHCNQRYLLLVCAIISNNIVIRIKCKRYIISIY